MPQTPRPPAKPNPSRRFFNAAGAVLFFLFAFLLPSQLGRHFFAPFSYVDGIRIDYLAPTLFLTDILAVFLIAMYRKEVLHLIRQKAVIICLGLLLLSGVFSLSFPLFAYRFLKVLEFLGVFAALRAGWKRHRRAIADGLALGTVVQLPLVIFQMATRHSLQGVWYFLGERYMSLSTPGIAKATLNGTEILRPYGSFSHPNSLAGFFLLVYLFFLVNPEIRNPLFKYPVMAASTFLIFFSFSKNAILAYLLLTGLYFLWQKASCRICTLARLAVPLFLAAIFLQAGSDPLSLEKRATLMGQSLALIARRPLTGTGLGSYLLASSSFPGKYPYFFLQPVHNIYLLWAAETGLPAAGIIFFFLGKTLARLRKNKAALILALAVLFTGLADHYWLTLQQNWLLAAAIFGIMI